MNESQFLRQLNHDPAHLASLTQEERERRHRAIDEYMRAAAPVMAELADAGFALDPFYGISDLILNETYRKRASYRRALPILLRWLPRMEDQRVKESIVRTLSVPWAKPEAAPSLIAEFRRVEDPTGVDLKWAIGNALSVVADDRVLDELVSLLRDKGQGRAREMLAVTLGNMTDPRAVDALIELLADEEVAGHALIALGKLKAKRARSHIERFTTHPKAWVRNEARRALAKIDTAR